MGGELEVVDALKIDFFSRLDSSNSIKWIRNYKFSDCLIRNLLRK